MQQVFPPARRIWLAAMLAASMALGLSIALARVASAHATYDHSTPAAGEVLATAPSQVTVFFSENIDPKGSSLTVYHTEARNTYSFDQESRQVSPDNGTQYPVSDPKSMTIPMQGDGDGIYAVVWKTVSADDGDEDQGVFFFGVGTGNVLGTSSAAPTPTTTTSTASSGTPVWVTILVGIVALIVGAGATLVLAGRRSGPGSGNGPTGTPGAPDASSLRSS